MGLRIVSQHEHETIKDLSGHKVVDQMFGSRRTNHDESVCDSGEDVDLALKNKGKGRENSARGSRWP